MAKILTDPDLKLFIEIADICQQDYGWSEEKTASMVGKSARTISRWKLADSIINEESRNTIRFIHSLLFNQDISTYYPQEEQ